MKKVLVSGIQATGKLHFGNYFGAMKQNIDLANSGEYMSYIFVADYHALTTVKDKVALRTSALEIAAAYIACGLDLTNATLFRQSSVKEHTELASIFNNVVTMPYLMRAHAFKAHLATSYKDATSDSFRKNYNWDTMGLHNAVETISHIIGDRINIGLLDYPVLMAADILMYQADVVPVGQDQKQHIEYARDIAGFYNRAWGVEQFKLPKEIIKDTVAVVPGTDGQKMSKSKGNVISLFGSDEEVKKAVMGIVTDSASPTDSKDPDTNNVFNIHKLFLQEDEITTLRAKFSNPSSVGGYGYKQAKEELLATIMKWREGKKEVFDDLMNHPEKIEAILKEGGEKAKKGAQKTMGEVREQIGLY